MENKTSSPPAKPDILMRCEAVALQFAAALQGKEKASSSPSKAESSPPSGPASSGESEEPIKPTISTPPIKPENSLSDSLPSLPPLPTLPTLPSLPSLSSLPVLSSLPYPPSKLPSKPTEYLPYPYGDVSHLQSLPDMTYANSLLRAHPYNLTALYGTPAYYPINYANVATANANLANNYFDPANLANIASNPQTQKGKRGRHKKIIEAPIPPTVFPGVTQPGIRPPKGKKGPNGVDMGHPWMLQNSRLGLADGMVISNYFPSMTPLSPFDATNFYQGLYSAGGVPLALAGGAGIGGIGEGETKKEEVKTDAVSSTGLPVVSLSSPPLPANKSQEQNLTTPSTTAGEKTEESLSSPSNVFPFSSPYNDVSQHKTEPFSPPSLASPLQSLPSPSKTETHVASLSSPPPVAKQGRGRPARNPSTAPVHSPPPPKERTHATLPHSEKMVSVTVRNIETHDVRTFASLRGAAEYLGINPGTLCRALQPKQGQAVRSSQIGRFEVARTYPAPVPPATNASDGGSSATIVRAAAGPVGGANVHASHGRHEEEREFDDDDEEAVYQNLVRSGGRQTRTSSRRHGRTSPSPPEETSNPYYTTSTRRGKGRYQKKKPSPPRELPTHYSGARQVSISQSPLEPLLRENPFRERDEKMYGDGILENLRKRKLMYEQDKIREERERRESSREPLRVIHRDGLANYNRCMQYYLDPANVRTRLPIGDMAPVKKINETATYTASIFNANRANFANTLLSASSISDQKLTDFDYRYDISHLLKGDGLLSKNPTAVKQLATNATDIAAEIVHREFAPLANLTPETGKQFGSPESILAIKKAAAAVLATNAIVGGDCERLSQSLLDYISASLDEKKLKRSREPLAETPDSSPSNSWKRQASIANTPIREPVISIENVRIPSNSQELAYPTPYSPSLPTAPTPSFAYTNHSSLSVNSSDSHTDSPMMRPANESSLAHGSSGSTPTDHAGDYSDPPKRKRGRPSKVQ